MDILQSNSSGAWEPPKASSFEGMQVEETVGKRMDFSSNGSYFGISRYQVFLRCHALGAYHSTEHCVDLAVASVFPAGAQGCFQAVGKRQELLVGSSSAKRVLPLPSIISIY